MIGKEKGKEGEGGDKQKWDGVSVLLTPVCQAAKFYNDLNYHEGAIWSLMHKILI